MKRMLFVFVLIIVFLTMNFYSKVKDENLSVKQDAAKALNNKTKIFKQNVDERYYSNNAIKKVVEIDFSQQEEKNMIYFPHKLHLDNNGVIYIIDCMPGSYVFHKLIPVSKAYNKFKHVIFSPPGGQGPGDISRIVDEKIYKGHFYISDMGTGTIKIFTLDGEYLKDIMIFSKGIKYSGQFSFLKDKLVVENFFSRYKEGNKFALCDLDGKVVKTFGSHIDNKHVYNSIYHNNFLSQSFNGDEYYYLPHFLGFVTKYKNNKVVFSKETIDGLQNVVSIKKKFKGAVIRKIMKKKKTVLKYHIFRKYILIKSYNYEDKKSLWDIYTLDNFDYMLTIRDKPDSYSVGIYKNYLITIYESILVIYDINDLLIELKNKAKGVCQAISVN